MPGGSGSPSGNFPGGILLFVNADHSVLVACENQPVLHRHGLCLEYGAAPLPVAYAGEVGQFRQPEYMDARLAFGHIQPVARRHDGFYLTSETLLPPSCCQLCKVPSRSPFFILNSNRLLPAFPMFAMKGYPQMGDGIRVKSSAVSMPRVSASISCAASYE